MKKQTAFTLLEIAIILVIIGWFLGGILKCQCIVQSAKIKNLENDFQGITAAIYTYQDKYQVLPGDINGNGKIDSAFDSTKNHDESRLFWLHLRRAGLVAGNPNDQQQPINAFHGLTGVSTDISTGKKNGIAGLFVGFTNVPKDVAIIIESRSDDEKPNTGFIQAHRIVAGVAIPVEDYSGNGPYNLYIGL